MGNEASLQEQRYPVLAFERPPTHSQTASSLPDSIAYLRREDFIRRQESLPSEADYTDSSENSVVYRRRAAAGGNSAAWLRAIPGSSGTPSSEKGSLLDVLVKRLGAPNQASSSDEDPLGGRDVSSATSLQDSACEVLESSQQLSEEEKAQIKNVLDRVRLVENREAERLS